MRRIYSVIALLLLATPTFAQVPDTYLGGLNDKADGPAWRSFDDILASSDSFALTVKDDLSEMAEESTGACPVYELGHGQSPVVRGIEVRASLGNALAAADYSAVGEVVDIKPGLGPSGTFGSMVELAFQENFGKKAFPASQDADPRGKERGASRGFFFYPGFTFKYGGQTICAFDARVPNSTPSIGDRMIVFARGDGPRADPPFFLYSTSVFPVMFGKEGSFRSTVWRDDPDGKERKSIGDAVSELRSKSGRR